eukprot:5789370-Prorocentrum_lima.AAC.1
MTSSLVGSEMCIRDSGASARVGSATSGTRGARGCAPVRHYLVLACRTSVSYTHLTLPTICSV